jgi:hypothetical protein
MINGNVSPMLRMSKLVCVCMRVCVLKVSSIKQKLQYSPQRILGTSYSIMFVNMLLLIQQTFTNTCYATNYVDIKMDKTSFFPKGIDNLVNFTSSIQISQCYLKQNNIS